MTWHARLDQRLKELGWTRAELARRSHVKYDRLNKWMRGDVDFPRGDAIRELAAAVGVSEHWLLFGVDSASLSVHSTSGSPALRRAPLFDWGDLFMLRSTDAGSAPDPVRSYPVPDEASDRAFYVKAPDDSNSPVILEGDRLLCDPEKPAIPGKFVIAVVAGHAGPVLGRWRVKSIDNGLPKDVEIVPANDHFPVIRARNAADIHVLGRVIERSSGL